MDVEGLHLLGYVPVEATWTSSIPVFAYLRTGERSPEVRRRLSEDTRSIVADWVWTRNIARHGKEAYTSKVEG